jgi:cation:H+ antiporter
MIATIVLLVLSAVVIYLSCEFFVNGVEWVGLKAGVGQTAVGTILAAFGTALPESVVTLVAVAFSKAPGAKEIGVGAALGGPLVLGTIAYAVVGGVLLGSKLRRGKRTLNIDSRRLARDQGWFLVIFAFKVGLGLLAFAIKPWLGFVFLAAYGAYVWTEMRTEEADVQEYLEPLKLRPRAKDPGLSWALVQTGLALVVIFGASQLFVHQLEHLGPALGLSPTVVALLLGPIATELPETMNAIIWVRQGKEKLALANISGAMMIQATVPSAFGIFFTPWLFDRALILAAVITTLSVLGLFLLLRRHRLTPRRMVGFASLYALFAVLLPWFRGA